MCLVLVGKSSVGDLSVWDFSEGGLGNFHLVDSLGSGCLRGHLIVGATDAVDS